MWPEIEFRCQRRKTLAMKVTPDGVVVLLPQGLDIASPQARAFVQASLQRLPELQPIPPDERLTADDVHVLVAHWMERIGVEVRRVQVRTMRRKWASCSSQGTLTLNGDLFHLPRDLVEYVICHELVHLRVPEHSKGWQAMMGAYLPDWRERERRLAGWMIQMGKGGQRPLKSAGFRKPQNMGVEKHEPQETEPARMAMGTGAD